ncbi:hypothetical protein DFH09DRAFT_164055 [Mycena vulgaris]|nr:hypothetical protein DFH09DRAFT_164055 [Mycena vulgaris]
MPALNLCICAILASQTPPLLPSFALWTLRKLRQLRDYKTGLWYEHTTTLYGHQMSSLSETSLSLLASAPPPSSTASKVLLVGIVITLVLCTIYYASPMHLTRVLVATIAHTETIYLEALEAGVLSNSDVHTAEIMFSLQLKVSYLREASLRHSLSYSTTVSAFLKGRTLTLLQCIREVRALETRIEILKEEQLRVLDSRIGAGTVSLRRRRPIHA